MRKGFVIAGLVIAVILAAFLIKRLSVRQDDGSLLVSGNVEVTEINSGFKTSGRIIKLLAEEGRRVKAGESLAILDSAELQDHVLQGRAFLNEAIIRLDELKAGSRPQELEQARANVRHAEAEFIKAKKDFERSDSLYKKEVISAQQFDAAKKTLVVAESQHKMASEALSLVVEGPRKEAIRAAEQRVKQAEAALRASEARLKDTVIYAPVQGVILRKNAEHGETIAAGRPVFTIGDMSSPWVKVYVKEDKLGLIRLGQKAEVRVDSYPDKVYEGAITFISSEAEFTPKNVQTKEERVKLVFGVKISVKNINDELKPGMPADVGILLK